MNNSRIEDNNLSYLKFRSSFDVIEDYNNQFRIINRHSSFKTYSSLSVSNNNLTNENNKNQPIVYLKTLLISSCMLYSISLFFYIKNESLMLSSLLKLLWNVDYFSYTGIVSVYITIITSLFFLLKKSSVLNDIDFTNIFNWRFSIGLIINSLNYVILQNYEYNLIFVVIITFCISLYFMISTYYSLCIYSLSIQFDFFINLSFIFVCSQIGLNYCIMLGNSYMLFKWLLPNHESLLFYMINLLLLFFIVIFLRQKESILISIIPFIYHSLISLNQLTNNENIIFFTIVYLVEVICVLYKIYTINKIEKNEWSNLETDSLINY